MSCAGDTMSKAMMDLTLGELKIECDTCTNEFGCGFPEHACIIGGE